MNIVTQTLFRSFNRLRIYEFILIRLSIAFMLQIFLLRFLYIEKILHHGYTFSLYREDIHGIFLYRTLVQYEC